MAEIDIALSEGQKVEQQIQHHARIAGDMPAIRQDLPLHFLSQLHSVPRDPRHPGGHGDRSHGKRDPDPQSHLPIRRVPDDFLEVAHVKDQAFQKPAIKPRICFVQDHGRVGKPGDQSLRRDFRSPRNPRKLLPWMAIHSATIRRAFLHASLDLSERMWRSQLNACSRSSKTSEGYST